MQIEGLPGAHLEIVLSIRNFSGTLYSVLPKVAWTHGPCAVPPP